MERGRKGGELKGAGGGERDHTHTHTVTHAHTLAAGARSATRNAHTRTHLPQLAVDHDLLHLPFGAQLHVPVVRDDGRANVAAHGRVRTHHLLSRAAPGTFRGRTHARGYLHVCSSSPQKHENLSAQEATKGGKLASRA